jgi:hypothetical protein
MLVEIKIEPPDPPPLDRGWFTEPPSEETYPFMINLLAYMMIIPPPFPPVYC